MFGGQRFWQNLGIWLGLLGFGIVASAQDSQFAAGRFHEVNRPNAFGKYYFGIMGQVARPGVYELAYPEPQLLELIRHAGGLTQQATNQLRIIRQGHAGQRAFYEPSLTYALLPGDIVVADGPIPPRPPQWISESKAASSDIQTADLVFRPGVEEAQFHFHVALLNVLDRPVILPVPESHANVPAVLAYLGQDPQTAAQVKVLPAGPARPLSSKETLAASTFLGPTVLYFNPHLIRRDQLPKLEEVYRISDPSESPAPTPEEFKTADSAPLPLTLPKFPKAELSLPPVEPAPLKVFDRPMPHSEVVLPYPSLVVPSEPPLISRLRELEQQIPTPAPVKANKASKVPPSSPTTVSAADIRDDLAERTEPEAKTSWWTYARWGLLGLILAAIYARVRSQRSILFTKTPEIIVPVLLDEPDALSEVETSFVEPMVTAPKIALDEDVLRALVFNQLPILEAQKQPIPTEEKPPSRKVFRFDPPEEQAAITGKTPYIQKRPKSKPAEQSAPNPTQTVEEPQAPLSLLDRVLQRVNQRRAA